MKIPAVIRYDEEFDVEIYLNGSVQTTKGKIIKNVQGKWNFFVLVPEGLWRPYFVNGMERKSDLKVKFKREFLKLPPYER